MKEENEMEIQEIYDRQYSRIYRVAMLYLKNVADAEDAVQIIFIKFMEKKIKFIDRSHEDGWFITATKNYCKDVLKTFWRRKIELGELPEMSADDENDRGLLEKVLKLPIKYREVVYLYYYEEYTVREISKLLNRKESTIQTQLSEARKRLKKGYD